MRCTVLTIVVALVSTSSTLAQDASSPPAVTVKLKRLVEKREVSLEKTPFSGWENGIELKLNIDGPGVKGARKYGKLKVIEAKDDAGTDLTKEVKGAPKFGSMDHFDDVREPQQFGFGNDKKPKPTGFDIDVKLPTPTARAAKTIKIIRGEIQVLVGGQKKIIEVKSIKDSFGKPIDDPALKEQGVTFTINDPAKRAKGFFFGDPKKSVPVIIAGNIDAITSVSILDAAGEKVNVGSSWSDNDGKRSLNYDLEKPLADDMKLQIEVWPGQKTVTVPFEIKDLKLP